MSKILIISTFTQGTGYCNAAISYALALDSVAVDVVCRSVRMSGGNGEVPHRIKELLEKDLKGVTHCIQFNLPSEYSYSGKVVNLGSFAYETNKIPPNSDWLEQLRLMDRLIVPCKWQKKILPDDLFGKTWVIPYALDVSKFDKQYDHLEFDLPESTYKFYTISEFTHRKNVPQLLAAYYSAFDDNDDIALVVKTHIPNRDAAKSSQMFKETSQQIKQGLNRFAKLERYPKVILIASYLKNEQINALHQSCNCFISPSHCESYCYPSMDALGFGNQIICGAHTSFDDIESYNNYVNSYETPINGVNDSIPGLYSSSESWYNLDINHLIERMKYQFDKKESKSERNIEFIKNNYDYKTIGEKLKESIYA